MKKVLSLILIISTLLTFVSCFDNSSEHSDTYLSKTNTASDSQSSDSKADDDGDDEPLENSPQNPNEKVDFVACLKTLLEGYKWNPKSIIPEKLSPEYEANFVNTEYMNSDYSNFVSVSNIPKNGIGEQWNMVIDNISEAQIFFNILSTVDTLSTVSVTAFNNYIDQNSSDTAQYQFQEGIYSVTIRCTQDTVDYVLDYTATLPHLGEQSVQILLSMSISTQIKNVRIQLGDANAVNYTIDKNKYSFAIKYLDVRRAYFELNKNSNDTLTGHIYEYITDDSIEFASVADFYITDEYLTVVGNKARGMIGFDGAICELYSVSNGKMIAYEVKEKAEALVTYNTLWFDLEDVGGITSIKYVPKTTVDEKDKIYVNDSSTVWETKNYGLSGGAKVFSRRFDIEFRTQYFYYYDSVNECYEKIKKEVPMLFVQEEVFDDLIDDIKEKNGIDISINVNTTNLTKLKHEYSSKTELIEENREKYSVDFILEYIGNKKTFS